MIDVNSDTWIPKQLCPESNWFDLKEGSISRQIYDENGWTQLCHLFFEKAHKEGIT
jgi:predicted secreted protein